MNSAVETIPPARVGPNTWTALGGVWRLTARRMLLPGQLVTYAILAAVVGGLSWLTARHVSPEFDRWIVEFYLSFLLPIVAFSSAAGAIRDDLRPASTEYLFTRPLPRWQYTYFKYVSHLVAAQIGFLPALAAALAIGVRFERLPFSGVLLVFVLGQALVVAAASAFGFLCGMATSRYIVLGLVYGAVVEAGIGHIPTQLSRLSMSRQVANLIEVLRHGADAETGSALSAVGVLLLFILLTTAASAALLHGREFTGARGKEG